MKTPNEKHTIVFNNRRMPLVTRGEIKEVWLGYPYLDFGGLYFRYVESKQKPGTFFAWHRFNNPNSGQKGATTWIGEFTNHESLDTILKDHDINPPQCGKIMDEVADELGWELPEE